MLLAIPMISKYPSVKPFPPRVGLRRLRSLQAMGLRDIGLPATAREQAGFTSLMMAARYGTPSVVKALVSDGADTEARDRLFGRTALMWAISSRNSACFRSLIACRADIDARDFWGRTALWWASYQQHPQMVKFLLAKGANVNNSNSHGITALMTAARRGDPDTVQVLVEHGAGQHIRDDEGRTARDWAIMWNRKKVAALLRK